MNLRDAKARIDREHPEMTTDQKIAAIKALRESDRAARAAASPAEGRPASKPSSGPLWAVQVLWIAMIQLTRSYWHGHGTLIIIGWAVALIIIVATGRRYQHAKDRWEAAQRPE